jgi:hypothetical protein
VVCRATCSFEEPLEARPAVALAPLFCQSRTLRSQVLKRVRELRLDVKLTSLKSRSPRECAYASELQMT